jgi:cytochrome P450
MMVEAAQERAETWAAKGPDGRVDMLSEMAALTAKVIARAVFGGELGSTAAGQVIEGFTEYQQRIDQFNLGYFLGLDEGLPATKGPRLRRAAGKVHKVVDDIVARHAHGADDDRSLVATLTRKRDRKTGRTMSAAGVRNEAATIFMAGHETTAASMTWLWYILAGAPDVEARLHAELDEVLGTRTPTMADVPELVYTRAVIDERLRLYPPVPRLSRQAGADDEVCGVKVGKGSLILVVPWLLHRHRKYWDDPDTFRPERFLGETTPRDSFCYIPFAAGPRICAGLSFAQYEMVLLVAVLARRFRPRVTAGHTVRPVGRLTLRPEGGMPMDLKPTSP